MADDQPNAIVSLGTPGVPSDPPSVKLVAARGAAWQLVIMQLAELVGLCCVTVALIMGKLSSTEFIGALMYCLSGNVANKLRGKTGAASPTLALMAAGPALAKAGGAAAAARHVLMVVLAFGLLGCSSGTYQPDWAAIHRTAESMRFQVATLVSQTQEAKGARDAVCALVPTSPECRTLSELYAAAQQALATFTSAVDVYERAGLGGERVEASILDVKGAVEEFVVTAKKTAAAIAGIAKPPDPAVLP